MGISADFRYYTLPNGLRVVLYRNPDLPIVTINTAFHVGSKNEAEGKTGFAHLFEHLMFEGSANLPRGAYDRLCEQAGGSNNAYTSEDKTNYHISLPSNYLATGLWMESDRLAALAITEEALQTQRMVVIEEKRQREDNQPYGSLEFNLARLMYPNHPYGHTVIGAEEDIANATLADVTAFHDAMYRPNNAVLSLAGDFDEDEAIALIERYYADIPAGQPVQRPAAAGGLLQGEQRLIVHDYVQLPAVFIAYRICPERHADFPAVDLLSDILGQGESSRLYRRLVYDEQIASHCLAYADAREMDGLFSVMAFANPGHSPQELEHSIDRIVTEILAGGVEEHEREKMIHRTEFLLHQGLQTNAACAERFAHFALHYDDPGMIYSIIDRYVSVTCDDMARAAMTYLAPERRAVLHYVPKNGNE